LNAASEERPVRVYVALALGVICFASSPLLVRAADDAPGLAIAVWRTGLAALFLAPFAITRMGAEMRKLTRRDGWLILGAGALLAVHFIAWIESLYHTTIASASVLVTTSPLFLAVLGFVLLRERPSRAVLAAIPVAIFGAALIGLGDAGDAQAPRALLGNSLALAAAVLVSGYLIIGRVVRQQTSWIGYVFPLYCVVALVTLITALVRGLPLFGYDPMFYVFCALMALGPQIVGHGSFNYAVKYIPAALLGLLALLEPVFASVLAYFIFGEQPVPLAIAGMVIVLVGVGGAVFARWTRRRRAILDMAGPDQPVAGPLPAASEPKRS
jgi:drug/metabolite transporter (DMT)-like permease